MTEATRQLNQDVDAVADSLARGNLAAEEAAALWQHLEATVVLPMIQRLEEELDCDTLGAEAEVKLPTRLPGYSRTRGRFPRWLECTLINLVRDIKRRERSRGVVGLPDPGQIADRRGSDAEEPTPSLKDRLPGALAALRSALDELEQRPRARQQKTDYHAVLVLELRLAMARRLRGHHDVLAEKGRTRAGLTGVSLPWTASEEAAEIQPGWPKLHTVWAVLAAELDRTDDILTDDVVVGLLAPLPGVTSLTSVAWRQWRTRATQAASDFLGTDRWDRTVAEWL